jgi:hypothetical protein
MYIFDSPGPPNFIFQFSAAVLFLFYRKTKGTPDLIILFGVAYEVVAT